MLIDKDRKREREICPKKSFYVCLYVIVSKDLTRETILICFFKKLFI